jgi:hypothetical protein
MTVTNGTLLSTMESACRVLPMACQAAHELWVRRADHRLQHLQLLRQAQREARGQPLVVVGLGREAREPREPAFRVQHAEEVHQADAPSGLACAQHALQGLGSGAVPTTSVEVDEVDAGMGHVQASEAAGMAQYARVTT